MVCTLVSGYYPIQPCEGTYDRVKKFIQSVKCPIVFFVDNEEIESEFRQLSLSSENVVFVVFPMNEFIAIKKYGDEFWKRHIIREDEKHNTIDKCYYYYERLYFVIKAADINPFGNDNYIWCDSDVATSEEDFSLLNTFCVDSDHLIEDDKIKIMKMSSTYDIMMHSLSLLTRLTTPFRNIPFTYFEYPSKGMDTSITAARTDTWRLLAKKYDEMLKKYDEYSLHGGNPNYVIASIYFENNKMFSVVDVNRMLEYFSSHL